MQLAKDLWRPAIIAAPAANILARGTLEGLPLHWLPGPGDFRFEADPFGYWRDNRLHIFVEEFDYRDAVGRIGVHIVDDQYRWIEHHPAILAEPWHLSYPNVFDADGETWMLPEACASGKLTLYRAVDFPTRWEAAHVLTLDCVPIDATPLYHQGRWWLFYTPAGTPAERLSTLHLAYADRLTGPWTPHPANPIRIDRAAGRPGGTPIITPDGTLHLPLQDCARTYGGAIRMLRIDRLEERTFAATPGVRLTAPDAAAPCLDGCHTLAAAGPATLIDVKRSRVSLKGTMMRPMREYRRWRARILG